MAQAIGRIIELHLEAGGLGGWIDCPPGIRPQPGQYLLASGPDPAEPLPHVLFPAEVMEGRLRIAAPLPSAWTVGTKLLLRGPLGRGFALPHTARRLAMACLDDSPARLLPLAALALRQHAAVTLYARTVVAHLPEEVEVLPLDLLPEAPGWADFLALDTSIATVPVLRSALGLRPHQHPGCTTQVLVRAPMPCSGLAECGVCAVLTRDGWRLACSDGPVFDFLQLEEG